MNDNKKFHPSLKAILYDEENHENTLNMDSIKKYNKQDQTKLLFSNRNRYSIGKLHPNIYLSQREFEIMTLLTRGKCEKSISDQLCLSVQTIAFYIKNIKLKFCCENKEILIGLIKKLKLFENLNN